MDSEVTIEDLPNEMLTKIFSYIKEDDLAHTVRHVSQRWRGVVDETQSLWRNYVLQVSSHVGIEDTISTIKNIPLLKRFDSHLLNSNGHEIVNTLATYCRVLTVMIIPQLWISGDCMELIIESFPCLSELHFALNSEREHQIKAVSCSTNLISLYLQPYPEAFARVPSGLFVPLADGCPKLSILSLNDINDDTEDINNLFRKKKNKLECLGWKGPMHSSTFVCLGEFTVLKDMKIRDLYMTDVAPTFDNIPKVNLPSIERIVYLNSPIQFLSTLIFASLPSLISLTVKNCSGDIATALSIMFPRCENLQNLCLNKVVVDENVFTLINSRVLKKVSLHSCKHWGLHALRHITNHCRILTDLSLSKVIMTPEMGIAIFSLDQLETLCFYDCNLVHMDFRLLYMNFLPHLKFMEIENCKVYSTYYNQGKISRLRRKLIVAIS